MTAMAMPIEGQAIAAVGERVATSGGTKTIDPPGLTLLLGCVGFR